MTYSERLDRDATRAGLISHALTALLLLCVNVDILVRSALVRTRTRPGRQPHQHFSTCAAAIERGYGPYYRGRDVEYGWYTDSDSDGVVCEQ